MSMACTYWRRTSPRPPRCPPARARSADRTPRPRAPRASSGGTACCRPRSSPTGSCCGSAGPPMSSIFAERLVEGPFGQVPRAGVVDRAGRAALARRPVVGQQHHERVVEVAGLGRGSRAPGRSARRCGRGTPRSTPCSGRRGAARRRRASPRPAPSRVGATARRRRAAGPMAVLPLERLVAPHVPAAVEATALALDPVGGRLVGRVARARWRGRGRTACPGSTWRRSADELDGPVGQVLGQVVAVLVRPRRGDPVVVVERAPARTGSSRRRRTRRSARSRGPSGHVARGAPRCMSSSGVRCHLPTA